jgi:predicted alpha/beta superfamily hydrolase
MALNALTIDFRSHIRDKDYRLLVSIPGKPAPPQGYPVLYLIDGNLHFGITVDTMRIQACWPDVRDAVVVGIGYPTDSVAVALDLRMDDLTSPIAPERASQGWMGKMRPPSVGWGKMDDYLRMLDEEIKPKIAELTTIDAGDQTLMGHSLGGLTTLHALFRRTASFQHFVAISPSIWWDDCAVLAYESAFADRVRAGQVGARALISVGGLESTLRFVDSPVLPASEQDFRDMIEDCRMVPNTVELGERLAALRTPGFEVQTVVHEGDDHNMVPGAGLARGVRFAFRRG